MLYWLKSKRVNGANKMQSFRSSPTLRRECDVQEIAVGPDRDILQGRNDGINRCRFWGAVFSHLFKQHRARTAGTVPPDGDSGGVDIDIIGQRVGQA